MTVPVEFERKAPYAPISALREFFERIRDMGVPARVDRRFLQKLNVASNNEWALLSALKFLGIVDERGAPTHAYRLLQTTDQFQGALRHLVETAYSQLLDMGGTRMSTEDLQNYFRVASSPSQAKNAARFFREVCGMAGVGMRPRAAASPPQDEEPGTTEWPEDAGGPAGPSAGQTPEALVAKAALVDKLPVARDDWSAGEYRAICEAFLSMMRSLDGLP